MDFHIRTAKNTLLVVIDEPSVVNDVDKQVEILPNLVNHILAGENHIMIRY